MDRVTENDLLALIEGELPDERKPIVEAALRADPALVERVRRMKADREGLALLARGDVAPGGLVEGERLVEGAMARADRTRLVQVDTGGPVRAPSLARGSRGRRMQMAAAAMLFIGALGVWVWLMSIVSTSSEKLATHENTRPPIAKLDSEGKIDTEEPKAPPVGPGLAEGPPVSTTSVAEAMQAIAAPAEEESTDDSLLKQWLSNLDSESAPGVAADQMDWREAAELALAGRLRIEMAGTGPLSPVLADSGAGADEIREYQVLRKQSGVDEGWRVEVSFREGESAADLAGALETAVRELEARTGRHVRLSEAEGVDEDAGPIPAADIGSILWWSAGPEEWARRQSVRLPVVFAEK